MGRPYQASVSIRLTGDQRGAIIECLTHYRDTDEIELEQEYLAALDVIIEKFETLQAKHPRGDNNAEINRT